MSGNVLDAAHMTGQDYPGGARALAIRMNMNPATLSNRLNPNNHEHHLTVRDLMAMMALTGDHRALHAACMELGYMALPLPAQVGDDETTEALTNTCKEFSDYLQTVTGSLSDNKVTATELRRIRKELGEMVAAAGRQARSHPGRKRSQSTRLIVRLPMMRTTSPTFATLRQMLPGLDGVDAVFIYRVSLPLRGRA